MKKKLFALFAVLAFSMALYAEGRILTFLWDWDDWDVVAFRYQLDSEAEGGWTECEYYQTSASFEDLDFSKPHALYLQQSYDGATWSPSSVLTAEPPEEEVFPEEEPPEEPGKPPASAPPPQEAEPDKAPLSWNLGLAAGTKGALAIGGPKAAQLGLSVLLEDLYSFSDVFSLALEADLLCGVSIPAPAKLDEASLSLLLVFMAKLSPKLAVNLPVGLEVAGRFGKPSPRFGAGFDIGLGIGFSISDRLSASAKGLFHIAGAGPCFSAGAAFGLRF